MHPLAREDEFQLSHGGVTVRLRASLRAAIRLECLHDGFPGLLRKLDEFDTRTIRAVIRIAATDPKDADALFAAMRTQPIRPFHHACVGPVLSLCVSFLAPMHHADGTAPVPNGKTEARPWAEVFAEMYQIATGWLGWTPAEAWKATPVEIAQAFEGHIGKLKAIHGATDETEAPVNSAQQAANIAEGLDPEFDRAGLHALKARYNA